MYSPDKREFNQFMQTSSFAAYPSEIFLQISIVNKVKKLFKIDHEQILLYNQNAIRVVAIE